MEPLFNSPRACLRLLLVVGFGLLGFFGDVVAGLVGGFAGGVHRAFDGVAGVIGGGGGRIGGVVGGRGGRIRSIGCAFGHCVAGICGIVSHGIGGFEIGRAACRERVCQYV